MMARLKHRLKHTQDHRALHLCTIPSAVVTQAMAASGADGVIIDLEHGAIDYAAALAMIVATAGTDCAPMVRVTDTVETLVKRALDLGGGGHLLSVDPHRRGCA